jgi:hypothetical protein
MSRQKMADMDVTNGGMQNVSKTQQWSNAPFPIDQMFEPSSHLTLQRLKQLVKQSGGMDSTDRGRQIERSFPQSANTADSSTLSRELGSKKTDESLAQYRKQFEQSL